MTDLREKHEELKEKAKALIQMIKMQPSDVNINFDVFRSQSSFKNLKAALRPSREEIADWIDHYNNYLLEEDDSERSNVSKYLNYAIEELRK